MKAFDRLILMNGAVTKTASYSRESSDNEDESDLQQVLLCEANLCQMIRMRINKLKNERLQNINNERKFSITKMLHNLQKKRKDMMKQNKCVNLNV